MKFYRIVDSFFKYFEGNFLVEHFARNYYGKRGFKRMGMSQKFVTFSPSPTSFKLSLLMTLDIYRFFMQFSNLKAFHRFANEYLKERYPNFPNYENFLKATNKSFSKMMLFVNSVLAKNREKCAGETIHFRNGG